MANILVLKSGKEFAGQPFGAGTDANGEVVFSTGMVGYPQSLTDPSFAGQILVLTYPLIGSYGVPGPEAWESDRIWICGLVVSQYIETPSHPTSVKSLDAWLKEFGIPGIMVEDTRALTLELRKTGVTPGMILKSGILKPKFELDTEILVAQVSVKEARIFEPTKHKGGKKVKTVVLIDCGAKQNIIRCLLRRGVRLIQVPWNEDIFKQGYKFDAVVVSNGPGDPKQAGATIKTVKQVLARKIPYLGICLGNQILTLAAGGDTYKLTFGHRGQNQPCLLNESGKCYLTTQNHGYAVRVVPQGFKPWFININDGTNEGIIHPAKPWMSVQFHPEAAPGPTDTEWVFDYFLEKII